MKDFAYWKKLHDSDNLTEFNTDSFGQLWLKTKSIIRKGLISEFIEEYSIKLTENSLEGKFKELFLILQSNLSQSDHQLDLYLKEKNIQTLNSLDRESLVSELYTALPDVMRYSSSN